MRVPEVDYKGIFNSGSALYLILLPDDPKFTIVGASDTYLKSTMRTREDIVGKGVFEAFPPNPNDLAGVMEKTFRAAFARIMATKQVDEMPVQQYDIPAPGGGFETRYWSVTHTPVLDAHGNLTQMAQRVEDITELLRLKQRDRTRAREIEEANSKLIEANKELEAFSYSVSHDLRTPLRSMISFGEILLAEYSQSLDPEGKNYLERIVNAGKRMGLLIDGLLSLARISREEVRRENIDLSLIAHSWREHLASLDPARRVEVVIESDMKVVGDSRQLELVLQNLMNNAWKFTSKKSIARIEVGRKDQNNEKVYFVKDNGAGFNMQYASKLFGSFQRLHTEAEFAGTGIGLATVQKIIFRHGGKIWAESSENEGATFFFTLP